jgi:hypothetical protein
VVVALIFWLFLILLLLAIFGIWVVRYVLLPAVVLRVFFRSDWVPPALKVVVGWALGVAALLLAGLVGWSGHVRDQARTRTDHQAAREAGLLPVRLTAQQPGLRPYPLGRGHIEEAARHDSTHLLVVSGDMPDGQRLRARFVAARRGAAPRFEANAVAVDTDAGTAAQATGHSVYAPDSQTVSGWFRCVLPSGRRLFVSFPPTSVVLRSGDQAP